MKQIINHAASHNKTAVQTDAWHAAHHRTTDTPKRTAMAHR
jgi:hypothetical protein